MKEHFTYLHSDLKLSNWVVLLCSLSLNLGKGPCRQSLPWGELKLPLRAIRTALSQQDPQVSDPKTMIHLTFTVLSHVPTHLCPTFSSYKPGSMLDTLETVFERLVYCLPSIGLTALIPFLFLVSSPLVSLSLDFVISKWLNLVWLGPPRARGSCTLAF